MTRRRDRNDEHEAHDEHGHDEGESGVVELSPEAAAAARVEVAPVTRAPVPLALHTSAQVAYDARRLAHVSPRIEGGVVRVDAELGQSVKAGDRLAVLDSLELGELKATYLGARAKAGLAKKTLARERRLFADKITSQQSLIEAQTRREEAVVALRSAEERLRLLGLDKAALERIRYGDPSASSFSIVAPIDGRVVDRHLIVGEVVDRSDTVFTIADLRDVWVWVDVYSRDIARVRVGDAAIVRTDAWPDRAFTGAVGYLSDHVDPVSRALRARVDLANPDGALKPGMFANVTIHDPRPTGAGEGESADGGVPAPLSVPAAALRRWGSRSAVFVRTGPRRYERREVQTGARNDERVEVLDGLRLGDEVVVSGGFLLDSEANEHAIGGGHHH